jgi:mRNA-degrading endonuclease RelE of RelBE toxin-antitoxin system
VLKVGQSSWRVVFQKDDSEEELTVIAIGHRRNVYDEFP